MKSYAKGYRLERKIVNKYRAKPETLLAVRTAGSHSPVDVIAIIRRNSTPELHLIQAKNTKRKINMEKIFGTLQELKGYAKIKKKVIFMRKGKLICEEI